MIQTIAGLNLMQIESAAYTGTMNSLSVELVVDNQIASVRSSLRFSDAPHGCSERSGEYRQVSNGDCIWGRVQGQEFRQRETDDNMGLDTSGWLVATGIRRDVGQDWQVGAALSWESTRLGTSGVGSSDGYQLNPGSSATRKAGAAEYSGSIAYGYANDKLSRDPAKGSGAAESTHKVKSVAGHLRAAYRFGQGGWHFRPWPDAGVEWLDMPGFGESGATFATTRSGVAPFLTSTSLDSTQLDASIGARPVHGRRNNHPCGRVRRHDSRHRQLRRQSAAGDAVLK